MLKILRFYPRKGTFIIANQEGHLFRIPPKKNTKLLCVYGARSLRFAPPFACEMSWDVRGFVHRKKQRMELQEMKNATLGPQSATWMSRWKLGSMGYFTYL